MSESKVKKALRVAAQQAATLHQLTEWTVAYGKARKKHSILASIELANEVLLDD
jgi:hypothetical protein